MHVLITGATGLVGQGVLQECLDSAEVERVGALVRKPTGLSHEKLHHVQVADFMALDGVEHALRNIDACFYCAGARPVGVPEKDYRHVTVDLTLHVAQVLAKWNPELRFLYVSGAQSDPNSLIPPLRVKGEAEQALAALPLRTTMLRPGGIQPVHGEHSPNAVLDLMYKVGGPLMGLGVTMAPGMFTTTQRLGRAMIAIARMDNPPAVVENREINEIGA